MNLKPSDTHESRHAVDGPGDIAPRSDYLGYGPTVVAVFVPVGLTCVISMWSRIASDFDQSYQAGVESVWLAISTIAAGLILIVAVILALWIPAALCVMRLRRRMPEASFYILRRISGFWSHLECVDPDRVIRKGMQHVVLSVDSTDAIVWSGVIDPRPIARLPMADLTKLETNRPIGTPFRRRIVILTFRLGELVIELPLAVRRIAGFGLWRLTPQMHADLVARLFALSPSMVRTHQQPAY